MLEYVLELFSSAQFVPHAVCLLWRPDLLIMHGLSDFLICAAYLTIPVVIIKAVGRRPDLLDAKVARLFAAFITACALSHLTGLLTLWVPAYGFQGVVKMLTAGVSIFTAYQLARLLPDFMTMPSRGEMVDKEAQIVIEQRKTEDAEEARDKMTEFAYIASHDLKAPMRGIANQARFLLEDHGDALEPDAKRRLDRMQELCGQVDGLISTLLKYSRLGRSEAREEVDPSVIVEEIVDSISETLTERNATIVVETPLPKLSADPSNLSTILRNLIVNGLTYNEADEPRISIGFEEQVTVGGIRMYDAYYVRDNGIGIDAEFHDDVFRMFKRLHHRDAYGDGSGAGLSFVKKVIESNDGVIKLSSQPGQGSTFYFSFTSPEAKPVYKAVPVLPEGQNV